MRCPVSSIIYEKNLAFALYRTKKYSTIRKITVVFTINIVYNEK